MERSRQHIVVRPVRAGATAGQEVVIAQERGVRRSDVSDVTATGLGGGALVGWHKVEQEDAGADLPVLVRVRRVDAAGRPTSRTRTLARIPRLPDLHDSDDDIATDVALARSGDRLLAGWQTTGTRRRGDRTGVVQPVDTAGRALSGAPRTVTDEESDAFRLAARPGGFVASWTRWRRPPT